MVLAWVSTWSGTEGTAPKPLLTCTVGPIGRHRKLPSAIPGMRLAPLRILESPCVLGLGLLLCPETPSTRFAALRRTAPRLLGLLGVQLVYFDWSQYKWLQVSRGRAGSR